LTNHQKNGLCAASPLTLMQKECWLKGSYVFQNVIPDLFRDRLLLAHNLAIVFGHFQELGGSHLTLGDSCGVLPARLGHVSPQAVCRDARLARFSFTRAQKSATSHICLMGVPTHICAVGLYCKATRAHLRHARTALATKPRSASLVPKGSLSLTRMRIFAICRHISDGSIHLELHILNFRSIPHRLLL
jgi:hypothetical protein